MKKIKLLKTLLIPSLCALTLGTVTTIATSCGEQPKPSTYSVSGGSLALNGVYGTAGSDEKTWVLKKDGEVVTEDITWSIVEPVSGVSINDGKVSWTNAISSGTYKFKAVASYNNQTYTSENITLTIANKYEVTSGSLSLSGEYGTAGSDEKTWVLKKDGDVVTDGVTWSIVEPVSGVSINDGKVSWTNTMEIGTHSFKVAAAYNEQTYYSVDITLVINDTGYKVEGGSLALNGVHGTAGSDKNDWKLFKDGQEVTESVTWSIVDSVSGVSINNGRVSWTDTIQSGTYKFKVVATYKGLASASNTITLNINGVYQLVGESKKIEFVATNTGRDEGNEWHLMKDGEIVSEGVIWSLVPTEGSRVPDWIKLNENNEISWTNAVEGTYSFNIQAEYDGKTFTSSSPFVLNVAAKVFQYVEVLANENSTLQIINEHNYPNLSYSFNGLGWYPYVFIPLTISIPKDQTLYLKGLNLDGWSETWEKYSSFEITGDVSISGNVMGLLDDGTRAVTDIPCSYCFYRLFHKSSGITSVSDNFLPAKTLEMGCYCEMFYQCDKLSKAPKLSATALAQRCYSSMFAGCTSLITAPELPAMKLTGACYYQMFKGCTSLTEAPELPAMELEHHCYYRMFSGCASLTTAHNLPATTLAEVCYDSMFEGCSSLNSIKIGYTGLASDAPSDAFLDWVKGVANEGTFYYNGPDYVHPSLFYFPPLWVMKHY